MTPLTVREADAFAYLRFFRALRGKFPSTREIAAGMDIGIGTASNYTRALEAKGRLKRMGNRAFEVKGLP